MTKLLEFFARNKSDEQAEGSLTDLEKETVIEKAIPHVYASMKFRVLYS
jgi:hypothetical protein